MTLAKQAAAANVKPAFRRHMPEAQWEWLDEFAPATIDWPDEKPKRLQYPEVSVDKNGNLHPVELHVKLHECFGSPSTRPSARANTSCGSSC